MTPRLLVFLLLFGCDEKVVEGSQPGDCADGADNDVDGLFDCDDDSCAGAPDCETGGDTGDPTGEGEGEGESGEGEGESGEGEGEGGEGEGDTGDAVDYDVCGDGGAPYTEIQDAIDAATDGATIKVCAGVYGPIELRGADLTIEGVDGAADTVIFSGADQAVVIDGGTVTLRGFTIRGNYTEGWEGIVELNDTTATLEDLIVSDCSPHIVFHQEEGAVVYERITVTAVDGNPESSFTFYLFGPGEATVRHVRITDIINSYPLMFDDLELDFTNNIIANNTFGGRLAVFDGSEDMNVVNNVFYDNDESSSWSGHLIYKSSTVDFTNNIVAENSAASQLFEGSYAGEYNDFYNNTLGDDTLAVGTGNITADPEFTDAESGDYTLREGYSSCIDGGDPAIEDPDGSTSDIGAYGGPDGDWSAD